MPPQTAHIPNDASITASCPVIWPRAIILIDMNAFFAAIEQLDNPSLRGQPIAVTNGEQGTCIITCSYEARAYGIKTGMRLRDARKLCPRLIQRPSRPERYANMSRTIMKALATEITPDIEVFSVDEAFLDVTHCQQLYGTPVRIAHMAKRLVQHVSNGLSCSVGLSGDKTTAKYAAKLQKPNGFTVIPPWEAQARLADVPVTELCGIAEGIGRFLARYGVSKCGDMAKLPISILSQRFGNLGRRIWYMCQGQDPEPMHITVAAPKSMGHGKVMPPGITDKKTVFIYLRHMVEKLAERLRRHEMSAQHFFVGVRSYDLGWLGNKLRLPIPSNDGTAIYTHCKQVLEEAWQQEPVWHIQVTALDPQLSGQQLDLFTNTNQKNKMKNQLMDAINERYGDYTLTTGCLLNRSKMPNVIAPAWKPDGHRQTI
jgi:DNA polymerase IV